MSSKVPRTQMEEPISFQVLGTKSLLGSDKDIFFKCQNKKVPAEKIQKFRSFAIMARGGITLDQRKIVPIANLFQILGAHGLPRTVPCFLDLKTREFLDFDWNPVGYNGPTVWYFKWNEIECSITGRNGVLYIRIHEMSPGVGETIFGEIMTELEKTWQEPVQPNYMQIYTAREHLGQFGWYPLLDRLHRNMDTIYIEESIKKRLINGLTKFLKSESFYDKFGVTWKRVNLLHGPPGTGKTSTIIATASHFKKNLAKLSITPRMNSEHLEHLFQMIPDETWIIIEDIDALFAREQKNGEKSETREAKTSIDFSSLINVLDGITTKRGLVAFLTTNHIEKIDPALLRPGRIDESIKFDSANKGQIRKALEMLGPQYAAEHDEFISKHPAITIAELQKHLFDCIMGEKTSIL